MVGSGPGSECAKSWRFGRGGIVFELNPETKLANGSETVTHSRSTNPLTSRRDAPTRNGRHTENASHPSETDSNGNQSGLSRCAASEGAAHPSETDSHRNQSGISRCAASEGAAHPSETDSHLNQSGISLCVASEGATYPSETVSRRNQSGISRESVAGWRARAPHIRPRLILAGTSRESVGNQSLGGERGRRTPVRD